MKDSNKSDITMKGTVKHEEKKSATSLVSMTAEEKQKFTTAAKKHGLNLSAFFRLAANEYMDNHNW
ncbi:MAG: hypothetical protein ACI4ET_12440 [Bilifractor sp.]